MIVVWKEEKRAIKKSSENEKKEEQSRLPATVFIAQQIDLVSFCQKRVEKVFNVFSGGPLS